MWMARWLPTVSGTAASPFNRIWYAINRSPRDTTKDAIVLYQCVAAT